MRCKEPATISKGTVNKKIEALKKKLKKVRAKSPELFFACSLVRNLKLFSQWKAFMEYALEDLFQSKALLEIKAK